MDFQDFQKTIDPATFSTDPYAKVVPKPWGEEIHLAPETEPYMMKIIKIKAGCRLSLQAHDKKTESWTLLRGDAAVLVEDASGELIQIPLKTELGYTSRLGQRHRLVGITDCEILEASTPELGTTFRLEDDYARPDETEALRQDPNRGWKV